MTTACSSSHVFCETLPEGLGLYPFGERYPHELYWFDQEVVRRVDQLDRPAVYLDMDRVDVVSTAISAMLRLGKRAYDRGGRLVLCSAKPIVREVFAHLKLDRIPWLVVRDGGVPGGRLLLPDPAWLSWNNGAVAALARTIREERDVRLLPVLADALEEARAVNCRTCWNTAAAPSGTT